MPAWVKSPQLSDERGRETKWEHVLEWVRQEFSRGGDEGVPECSQHHSCVIQLELCWTGEVPVALGFLGL